jgi:hypothetical protein
MITKSTLVQRNMCKRHDGTTVRGLQTSIRNLHSTTSLRRADPTPSPGYFASNASLCPLGENTPRNEATLACCIWQRRQSNPSWPGCPRTTPQPCNPRLPGPRTMPLFCVCRYTVFSMDRAYILSARRRMGPRSTRCLHFANGRAWSCKYCKSADRHKGLLGRVLVSENPPSDETMWVVDASLAPRFPHRSLAFAMSQHKRLGQVARAYDLQADLVKLILDNMR